MTIIITDLSDLRRGDTVTLRRDGVTVTGTETPCTNKGHIHINDEPPMFACTDDGWEFVSATRQVVDIMPGTVGTATVRITGMGGDVDHETARVMRLDADATKGAWVDTFGDVYDADEVNSFVPDRTPRPLPVREYTRDEDEATSLAYWLAEQLGEHVDAQDNETLTDTVKRLLALLTGKPDQHGDKCGDPSCDC